MVKSLAKANVAKVNAAANAIKFRVQKRLSSLTEEGLFFYRLIVKDCNGSKATPEGERRTNGHRRRIGF